MIPDISAEGAELRAHAEALPEEYEKQPVHVRKAESTRRLGRERIKRDAEHVQPLPDGTQALVLRPLSGLGPDTITLRALDCDSARRECVEILAATRDATGTATEKCLLQISLNGQSEFDLCRFAQIFDFKSGTQLPHEERIRQFYEPLFEAVPVEAEEAATILARDWEAGILRPSGTM